MKGTKPKITHRKPRLTLNTLKYRSEMVKGNKPTPEPEGQGEKYNENDVLVALEEIIWIMTYRPDQSKAKTMACPICDGNGHWVMQNKPETCSYCEGGGLVSQANRTHLMRCGKILREVNNGVIHIGPNGSMPHG